MESEKIIRIINQIHEAFSDDNPPINDQVISGYGGDIEAQEIKEAFSGKHWRDITPEFLNNYCIQSISFLEFPAYRFFLPAFILASVKEYESCFDIVVDVVATLLHPVTAQRIYQPNLYKEKETVDIYTFACRMNDLTCEQVEVIIEFLKFLCDYHISDFVHKEPQLALDEYWLERLKLERLEREN